VQLANQKDLATGAMYVVFGVAVAFVSTGYGTGSAMRMGPGYFPFWLGVILAGLGVILILQAAFRPPEETQKLTGWDLRVVSVVLVSVLLFGLLLRPLGLPLTVAVLTVTSSFANRESSWTTTALTAIGLAALGVLVFVYGLGLPMPLWPAFLTG
jgi:hypothetical protein